MDIEVGDKVTWSRAQANGVDNPLTVHELYVKGRFTFAVLKSDDGRYFTQVVQPSSLEVVR